MIEMFQPHENKVVQALAPQRLDQPLHMRVAQRGADGQPLGLDALLGQFVVERLPELRVVIAHDDGRPGQARLLDFSRYARRGIGRPAGAGPEDGPGDDHPTALDMDERQHRGGHAGGGGRPETAFPKRQGTL